MLQLLYSASVMSKNVLVRFALIPSGGSFVIFIPFCYSEAAVNFLTNPALDPFGKIPELKFSAASLQKVDQHVAAE